LNTDPNHIANIPIDGTTSTTKRPPPGLEVGAILKTSTLPLLDGLDLGVWKSRHEKLFSR